MDSDPRETPAPPVEPDVPAERQQNKAAAYRRGIYVLAGLAVLTAIEFGIALLFKGSTALLFVIILAKAGLIIQYYMHINKVWSEEVHA